MTDVVGVHGIGQQQGGRNQILGAWQPALADGLERASGRGGPGPDLDLAYYGDLFLASTGTKEAASVDLHDLDDDTLDFLSDVERDVVDEEADEPVAEKGFKELPLPVARLAGWLDRRFGVAGRLLFFGDLIQVRRYQRDGALADEILGRVREAIDDTTRVVVGHSLGSVVAYEFLCGEAHNVSTLITIGSPLALRSIQDALRTHDDGGTPAMPQLQAWSNVYDRNDPVSCGGGLSPTWSQVTDQLVDNGGDPHAATRYLGKRATGQAVAGGLGS